MKPMTIEKTALHLGADKPFELLHVSDTHIALADERDDLRKRRLAQARAKAFEEDTPGCSLHYFRESCRFANERGAMLVHTGDLFDFVSEKHFDMAPELMALPNDAFFAVGNHEFSLYVGEAFEDETYKAQTFDRVQAAIGTNDLRFASRVVNGVNLIAIDNSYYSFSKEALESLKQEAEKGLPILLFLHTPLYTPELYDLIINQYHVDNCALAGVPAELMEGYNDHRYRQQIATPQTKRFLDYLYQLDLLKAIFAGHLHYSHQSPLVNGVMQYVTGTQSQNIARLITID